MRKVEEIKATIIEQVNQMSTDQLYEFLFDYDLKLLDKLCVLCHEQHQDQCDPEDQDPDICKKHCIEILETDI